MVGFELINVVNVTQFLDYQFTIKMSLLDLASCVYAKTIVNELFSNDNELKKNSAESMKQFVGRVNVAHFKTMSSPFNNGGIPFKTFTDKFSTIIK